jgi:ADP-dependent glucokinase
MDDSFSTSIAAGSRRVPLDVEQPVSCWDEELKAGSGDRFTLEICVAPVLVCTEAYQTAGGGDNISSAGLFLQI